MVTERRHTFVFVRTARSISVLAAFASIVPRQVSGSAARILALLVERYPVTLRQVALALRLRPDVVEREARKLAAQRLVVLEPLGEETYIALSGEGATLQGLPAKEVERLRARRPAPAKPADVDDPAFG